MNYNYLLNLTSIETTAKGLLFGIKIPFIPDFLLDHTLLGKEPSARIFEYSRRWNQFISGLWSSSEDVTYTLRYDLNHVHKNIETYILGKLHLQTSHPEKQTHNQAIILLKSLARMLESFGFEPQLLMSDQLQSLVQSIGSYNYCVEICQEEVDTPIGKDIKNEQYDQKFYIPQEFISLDKEYTIYGIRPWWGSGGTFLTPFHTLASQNSPISVCILITPTLLKATEKHLIAEIARQAESLSQMQTKSLLLGSNPSQNKTDPQLRWESRIYAANLRRLNQPFLTTILCFSSEQATAQQVAKAFASTIREEQPYDPPLGESEIFSSGVQVHSYGNDDITYLQKTCQYLDFRPLLLNFHSQNAPHDSLRRLRYLMDGRGAACAFRFPISVEGGVPGIPVKQRPPDFHPGARNESIPANAIDLGRFHVGGRAYVSKNAFTKHALIIGFTGSGKSNTCLYLLDQFWRKFQIPFLVIESAKKEYRGLRNVDIFKNEIRIYTLGNETVSPLRSNPFQLIEGVRVESHLANLQTCFEGALPHVGPLPSVIAESLENIYRQYGWQLTDFGNALDPRQFPTMQDFYITVEEVLKQRGYQGEVKSNLEAAIKGRIKPLLMGSKGKMFSQSLSVPNAEDLFKHPVILELNDLNEQDKSLVMMFFLTLLREYRELNPSKELTHITLVEEAHNVLSNVTSSGNQEGGTSDVKAKSVQSFCNMLAEVRAYGEGLIIADQSPEKLARDAMRNTNVQIAHQLRDAHDREAIANAMIMSQEQQDFLGKCETGRAAVFYTGLQKATFIDVPVYKDPSPPSYEGKSRIENFWQGFDDHLSPRISDEEVNIYMSQFSQIKQQERDCFLCQFHCECQCRDLILKLAEENKDRFKLAYNDFLQTDKSRKGEAFKIFAKVILEITNVSDVTYLDFTWCFAKEMLSRIEISDIDNSNKELFINVFKQLI